MRINVLPVTLGLPSILEVLFVGPSDPISRVQVGKVKRCRKISSKRVPGIYNNKK